MTATPATRAAVAAGVDHVLLAYDYDAGGDGPIGIAAAHALGERPSRLLKTLMLIVDARPACAVIASDRSLSMKRVAAALGAKAAAMMAAAEAERTTGYRIGGISPLGQQRRCAIVIDAAAVGEPHVLVNAGRRGLQLRCAPADLVRATGAIVAAIAA